MIQRLNISLKDDVVQMAKELEELRHKPSFSALLSDLIVEEWERRQGSVMFSSSSGQALNDAPATPEEKPYKYRAKGLSHREVIGGRPPGPLKEGDVIYVRLKRKPEPKAK